ncbi:MAG TPA: hypothetical protein VGM19_07220 [Armatimonadota bacterium]|jgi:hypothetical protein
MPKRSWVRRNWPALIFMGLIVGFWALVNSLFMPFPTLGQITEMTGITFPPGSRLLFSSYAHWMDSSLSAKIRLRPDQVDDFQASLPVHDWVPSREHIIGMDDDSGLLGWWWRPGSSKRFVAIEYGWTTASLEPRFQHAHEPDAGGGLEMLIAFDQGRSPVLYLEWFGD